MALVSSSQYDALLKNLTGPQRDAASAVISVMSQFGLESLAPKIAEYVRNGYSADTVTLLLQDTPEYQQRFIANKARIKAGLPALSPGEYIATERAYGQVLRKYGVPAGFYDQPGDFQKFLENDMSPAELDSRAQAASDFIQRADPNQMNFFKQYYTQGDMVAYALDPKRAEPLVGKAFQAASLGGDAAAQGLDITKSYAEHLAGQGLTEAQARQGFGIVATDAARARELSAIYAGSEQALTTQDLMAATLEGDAKAQDKANKLASRERAAFGGSSGVNKSSLQSG